MSRGGRVGGIVPRPGVGGGEEGGGATRTGNSPP